MWFFKKIKNQLERREQQLIEIVINIGGVITYDCLIPGSGGKDSFMQAHLLKYKYGMHPLTCTWALTYILIGDGKTPSLDSCRF